jgi:hypothetical protein
MHLRVNDVETEPAVKERARQQLLDTDKVVGRATHNELDRCELRSSLKVSLSQAMIRVLPLQILSMSFFAIRRLAPLFDNLFSQDRLISYED